MITIKKIKEFGIDAYKKLSGAGTSADPYQEIVTIFSEAGIAAGVDAVTESLQTVTYEHHEIHSGSHYFIDGVIDLSINEVYDIQLTTPNTTKWAHMVFTVACENETMIYTYEDVTIVTPGGTSYAKINNNRNSSNTSGLTVNGILNTSIGNANADTDVSGATILNQTIVGSGRSSGSINRASEIILKQNTDYSMRIIASAAGYTGFHFLWYEHINKH